MDNRINKENVNLLFDKSARLINYLFPGVFVMELIFKKGYFSNQPNNLIEGILFVFWCVIFSIPYNYIQPPKVMHLLDILNKKLFDLKLVPTLEFNVEDEKINDISELLELGFTLVKICISYFAYKFICHYFTISIYLGINIHVCLYILTMSITMIISYLLGPLYAHIITNFLVKVFKSRPY